MSDKLKVETIPFHPEHVKVMLVREQELKGIFAVDNIWERLDQLYKISVAITICYDGRVLGVMGYIEMWPGVCEVWVIPSRYIEKYGTVFARKIKQNLERLTEVCKMHRIQVTAIDNAKHNRWLEWLGFTCEGVLRNYTFQKHNFKMWSRV